MRHRNSTSIFILSATLFLFTVADASAQNGTTWSHAADIRNGVRGTMVGTVTALDATRSFTLSPDQHREGRASVFSDESSTLYSGFGSADRETFRGSAGFAKLVIGDRVEVRGTGTSQGSIAATHVALMGRSVSPGGRDATTRDTAGRDTVEGVVRQVNSRDNRVVIETGSREMISVLGKSTTPVYFRGEVYRITNIEVGDRIRVEVETTTRDGVRADAIDVLSSVSDSGTPGSDRNVVTSISGKVSQVDDRTGMFRMVTGRSNEVRVDTRAAYDARGRRFDLTELRKGDTVEVSGQYGSDGSFRADTIRMTDGSGDLYDDGHDTGFSTVVIYGIVERAIAGSDKLIVRDSTSRRAMDIEVVADFIVKLRTGNYVTADQLKKGDSLVIQAFSIGDDRFVAQTIRTR